MLPGSREPGLEHVAFTSDFLNVLEERGFIHQCTDLEGLDALAHREVVTAYVGFDATAPSLHVGHLIQIMLLYWLQQTGHRPIALMGGGTTKVGDPTGKDTQRALLTDALIQANIASIKGVFANFLRFGGGPGDAIMANNDDWLSRLGYVEFLRDYGTQFTINRMLTFESVKLRLERESPMTFLEFNYMLMQAYDFHELYRRHGCRLQMGGSDQWGNIVNGVELCRRKDGAEVYGLTTPLLTTASGRKMGKTESGAIWLNAAMCKPYDYWQYWRNVEDADVAVLLARFTRMPMDEVRRLAALGGAEINEAKKRLATEATSWVHGAEAAAAAAETARRTFDQGGAAAGLPTISLTRAQLRAGYPLLEALLGLKLIASKSEGRRHLGAGALRINNAVCETERALGEGDVVDGGIKLSVGRKRHGLIAV
ncbi:MAG: tyrosine--tRNA ligase [Gammaproteobacteria bacterium]|nr:tyrosine--tRNA ligase [Gammaproteobacteria bacterium]